MASVSLRYLASHEASSPLPTCTAPTSRWHRRAIRTFSHVYAKPCGNVERRSPCAAHRAKERTLLWTLVGAII
jgi:hypothetical protein